MRKFLVFSCDDNEYKCRLSKQCIELSSRCDGNYNCDQREDELDCCNLLTEMKFIKHKYQFHSYKFQMHSVMGKKLSWTSMNWWMLQ